jgi:GR25 family glycosyltransferase involved in LPS biosynthesis
MNKISKIFYINLSRRTDRNEHFLNSCKKVGISNKQIERYEALDGQIYKPTSEEKLMFTNCDYKNKWFYYNILCNQLGHYNLLKEIVLRGYKYTIICQDDVYFRNDFIEQLKEIMNNIPPDAEIINIGFHAYANGKKFIPWDLSKSPDEDYNLLAKNKTNEYICKLKNESAKYVCSLAYIVTLQGAINLVKYFDTNGFARATDGNFNDYCIGKDIFYGSIPVLCTGNADLGSDIF